MQVLGLNLGITQGGKPLKDGGIFLYDMEVDSRLYVSEERVSGIKYKGGFESCLQYMTESGISSQPQFVFYSTCCEELPKPEDVAVPRIGQALWLGVGHHESHAALTFASSGFRRALVVVMDGGGNVLQLSHESSNEWWRHCREQSTYWIAEKGCAQKIIGREFDEPYAIGFGEFWRYMTYLVGFGSSTKAAKTMELAAHSSTPISDFTPYQLRQGRPYLPVENAPFSPVEVGLRILNLQSEFSLDEARARKADVARWAQFVLEEGVIARLRHWASETGERNLCLSGGVALNCRLVAKIRSAGIFEEVHTTFAPSDKGQAIGNVLVGLCALDRPVTKVWYNPFMGPRHVVSMSEVENLLSDDRAKYIVTRGNEFKSIVTLIENGALVATCWGPAEVGERALGNRSILASPFKTGVKEKLNKLKGRPSDTPIAPVVSKDFSAKNFVLGDIARPYMAELALPTSDATLPESILHVDGTSRLQVVEPLSVSLMSRLLKAHTELGFLSRDFVFLNTSFNRERSPIVEGPEHAIDVFRSMSLDALLLDGILVRMKSARHEFCLERVGLSDEVLFDISEVSSIEALHGTKFGQIEWRTNFSLFSNYVNWLDEGRKVTTIRFVPGGISLPSHEILPLVTTRSFRQSALSTDSRLVKIYGVLIKRFGKLNIVDAKRDGFEKTSHLKKALKSIYPNVLDQDWVSINFIEPIRKEEVC